MKTYHIVLIFLTLSMAFRVDGRTRKAVVEDMKPYTGRSVLGVDPSTMYGKVMAGYQGWFTAKGDILNQNFTHYKKGEKFEPGHCTIDLWPDMSDYDEDEKYSTKFRHRDGSTAHVFSSLNAKTATRHYKWMQEYGIDGTFVQRFATRTITGDDLWRRNRILELSRVAANLNGRAYAVMYDLSGLKKGGTRHVIEDWKILVDRMKLGRDPGDRAYLQHGKKPVVAVWGIGFKDRAYTLNECHRLVRFLKNDPVYGGNTVLLGVPTGWRELNRDSVQDQKFHEIIADADIVSPWTIGRYRDIDGVKEHVDTYLGKDTAWCEKRGLEYLPVVFPGFSWHNMKLESPIDKIPRLKGKFLWSQYHEVIKSGARMIYQAMFDELDEGTAIFKCENNPPVGSSQFLTFEDLPSDHYLWLTGMGGKMLRNELKIQKNIPTRSRP